MSVFGSVLEHESLDNVQHDLVCSLEDLMHSQVPQNPFNWILVQVPVSTMQLQSIISNIEALVSGELLGHSSIHSCLGVLLREKSGSLPHHQSRRFQLNSHLRQLELVVLEGGESFAELLPIIRVLLGSLQSVSCTSKGTTRDVDPAAIETAHGDLETLASLSDDELLGDLGVLEDDHPSLLVVPTHFVLVLAERETWGVAGDSEASDFLLSGSAHQLYC